MQKKKKRPNILIFAILTSITVATWVAFDVYRSFVKPAPVSVSQETLAPLSPTINEEALSQIQQRLWIGEEEARRLAPAVLPSPSPSPTPEATEEAQTAPATGEAEAQP